MTILSDSSSFSSPVHRFWAKHLESAIDRVVDSIAAGQPPRFKDEEIIRVLYARLKGAQR